MNMKSRFLLFLTFACIKLHAQNNPADSVTEARLAEAKKYLMGIGIPKDEPSAFSLYSQLAQAGNPKAMNVLGKLYSKGVGVPRNKNLAIQWFSQAAQNGIVEAWYNTALLYKEDTGAPDFAMAYQYFDTAAKLGDEQSIYALAYMHYKGLGCLQDYNKAAMLFKKGATSGRANSMYFYGLCWRNGYGVTINQDSAMYWLQKAAGKGYRMAINELASNEPENSNASARILSSRLKSEFLSKNTSLNTFQRVDANVPVKVTQGDYEGYLIRYDWSGQHAISSSKLKLKLASDKGQVSGQWVENDSIIVPLNASINASAMTFSNTNYTRKDHYNPKKGGSYLFRDAKLQWSQKDDTLYLTGIIQMFSAKQNEPDKPMFISLKRYVGKNAMDKLQPFVSDKILELKDGLNAYPNPFINTITVDFDLKQKSEVQIQLVTFDGKIVYEKKSGTLEPGAYTFPIHSKNLSSGTYILKVFYDRTFSTNKVVKM